MPLTLDQREKKFGNPRYASNSLSATTSTTLS